MTTATVGGRHSAATPQVLWTRMGRSMGATESAAMRDEIRAAVERMVWKDPDGLGVLHEAPVRSLVAGMFFGRRDELRRAGTVALAAADAAACLIGLEDIGGSRYFLLHRTDGRLVEALYVLRIDPPQRVAA